MTKLSCHCTHRKDSITQLLATYNYANFFNYQQTAWNSLLDYLRNPSLSRAVEMGFKSYYF